MECRHTDVEVSFSTRASRKLLSSNAVVCATNASHHAGCGLWHDGGEHGHFSYGAGPNFLGTQHFDGISAFSGIFPGPEKALKALEIPLKTLQKALGAEGAQCFL